MSENYPTGLNWFLKVMVGRIVPSNRDRLNVDISGLRSIIQQMADSERRSLSSMVRILIEEGLKERGKFPYQSKDLPTMAQLVSTWNFEQLALDARLPIERIQAIAHGERPTDDDLIALGRVLEQDTSQLLAIRQRDFPRAGNGQGKKNG